MHEVLHLMIYFNLHKNAYNFHDTFCTQIVSGPIWDEKSLSWGGTLQAQERVLLYTNPVLPGIDPGYIRLPQSEK
jgi:hypothetical protein